MGFSRLLFTTFIILFSVIALGQQPEDELALPDDTANTEFGFHLGNVLPNQIDGITEIAPQWGVRGGFRLTSSAFAEFGGIAGKGEGVDWTNIHISLRIGVPIETLMGIVFIGGDLHHLGGEGREKKTFGGGHVGGGIMSHIADAVWFRTDMKFNVNPGTSLYIGAGFIFRLG